MRALILIAVTALSLGACKNNDQTDNTMNVDENLTAENIVSNDVTAIDAVTGDAANMAADVDMNFGNLDNSTTAQTTNQPAPKSAKPTAKNVPAATGNTTTRTTNAE